MSGILGAKSKHSHPSMLAAPAATRAACLRFDCRASLVVMSDVMRVGPLAERHIALRAKFGPFGGWEMPIEYAGAGVLAEYRAVRTTVGLFDVSHMGTLVVRGPGAADAAQALHRILTNNVAGLAPGRAQYNLLCEPSGGVIDDVISYRRVDEVVIVPNAGNVRSVRDAIRQWLPEGVTVTDLSADTAILAVQGPRSAEVLSALGLPADLDYLGFVDTTGPDEGPVLVARTGYTGEHGYELIIPVRDAGKWWDCVHAGVVAEGGSAAGLGARDLLRTEMGYPLYGHELSPTISPVQAGLGWAVSWVKPQFCGRSALIAEREAGPKSRLRALRCTGRGIARAGMAVATEHGPGEVTSGTFSPALGGGIALALLPGEVELGADVVIDIRGRACAATVVRAPFVPADPRR